ncbi:hypothetical protein [Sulfurihydrogenibium azorense]|uniref:hypothetical protein n=1 Tax=Sulfurihydrogenibium azorense TaxID=309806 RepID=UPI00240A935E|nr:hypothetical protein [Sulfurihydrogenibium azorense]MDM7273834.1 hypothetical protein [Sulfurihydrogenibium azorense]
MKKIGKYKEEILLIIVSFSFLFNLYFVDSNKLIYNLLVSLVIFTFSLYCWKVSNVSYNKSVLKNLSNIIKGDVATFLGFSAFVSEFILFNFLFEYTKNFIEENKMVYFCKAIISFIGILSIGLLFFSFYQEKIKAYINSKKSLRREPRKVLIFALSKLQQNLETLPRNWQPIKELLEFHKSRLEVAYVLISEETEKYKTEFEKFFTEFKSKIKYIEKVNMNDESSIVNALINVVRDIKNNKYEEQDISVYLSGGTSLVTTILSLFGVNDDIQVEYILQTSGNENEKPEIKTVDLRKDLLSIFVSD